MAVKAKAPARKAPVKKAAVKKAAVKKAAARISEPPREGDGMSKISYYFYRDSDPASETYQKNLFLARWRVEEEEKALYLEKWTGEAWINWPELSVVTGFGGDHNYFPASTEEAYEYLLSGGLSNEGGNDETIAGNATL
jgi:hypothetical protein